MGKPTGFMEIDRQTSREIAPEERIKNFNEFHIPLRIVSPRLFRDRFLFEVAISFFVADYAFPPVS